MTTCNPELRNPGWRLWTLSITRTRTPFWRSVSARRRPVGPAPTYIDSNQWDAARIVSTTLTTSTGRGSVDMLATKSRSQSKLRLANGKWRLSSVDLIKFTKYASNTGWPLTPAVATSERNGELSGSELAGCELPPPLDVDLVCAPTTILSNRIRTIHRNSSDN